MTVLYRLCRRSSAAAIAMLAASGALSQSISAEMAGFRTPSGNIHCMYVGADSEFPANLRCDIMQVDTPLPKPPRDCEGEWGRSFSISAGDAIGQMICVGDAVFNESNPVLDYGQVWQQGGFTCTSDQNGISCFNAKRHGFSLSRGSRKVY